MNSENTSDNTQAQALNKTDVSTRCDGSRYNFKKGMEFCPNKENCKLYEYHKSLKNPYDYPRKRFDYISDFRKCTEYKQ
jgi:hypothetical protein